MYKYPSHSFLVFLNSVLIRFKKSFAIISIPQILRKGVKTMEQANYQELIQLIKDLKSQLDKQDKELEDIKRLIRSNILNP